MYKLVTLCKEKDSEIEKLKKRLERLEKHENDKAENINKS